MWSTKKTIRSVFKQNMVVRQWGAIKQSVGQIGIYVTLVNTIMVAVTLYSTGWVQKNVININFVTFMGILLGLVTILLLWSWKVDVPSFFSSWNDQFWSHGNKMRDYMEEEFRTLSARIETLATEVESLKKGSGDDRGDDSRTEDD